MDETFIEALMRAKRQLLERQKRLVQDLGNGQFEHLWMLPQLRAGLHELDRLIQRERARAGLQRTSQRAVELKGLLASLTERGRTFASGVQRQVRQRFGRRTGE
jgi:hypothetical protein